MFRMGMGAFFASRMLMMRSGLNGTVVSTKMDKSILVEVERFVMHDPTGKRIRRRKKYMAHDENEACREGDVVALKETRPISKRKKWVVESILQRKNYRSDFTDAPLPKITGPETLLEWRPLPKSKK